MACYYLGIYNIVTRFTGPEILGSFVRAMIAGLALFFLTLFLLPDAAIVPRSVPIIYLSFGIFTLTTSRYLTGLWLRGNSLTFLASLMMGNSSNHHKQGSPTAIYGSGAAGRQVCGALSKGLKYQPVAYIDDDTTKHGTTIAGLKIFSPHQIPSLIKKDKIEKILLAVPSANIKRRKQIIDTLTQYNLHIITMPGLEEVAEGRVSLEEVRDVSVEEILGRTPIAPKQELLTPHIRDKNVLVTGAGGSIGSELCRQIIKQQPTSLILFENSEVNLYKIYTEIETICSNTDTATIIYPVLGSVARSATIGPVIENFKIHTVYHAAAYKHVPLVEYNSDAAFANNILGTLYTAEAAILGGVEKFVLVSTDKAVRPTNFMGATKRMAELILQALNNEQSVQLAEPYRFDMPCDTPVINNTKFTMVRFGNVLESSGSVVPKFRQQISDGGPITVTH
ncbi:MAG: polysaccharide biosynthesis protein, partial [Porticoccaceae bacterium]|nr:polysaccharide biosynthesis protein [Porticoccaceae bacterium]